jgi:hypothetical protein
MYRGARTDRAVPAPAQVKNLKRMKKQLERDGRSDEAAKYDFYPTTYVVPQVRASAAQVPSHPRAPGTAGPHR